MAVSNDLRQYGDNNKTKIYYITEERIITGYVNGAAMPGKQRSGFTSVVQTHKRFKLRSSAVRITDNRRSSSSSAVTTAVLID